MLRQTQQQKLLQKLSPQQIQLMKLLQIPTANLEERIKEELEENPALETGAEEVDDEYNLKDEEEETYDPFGRSTARPPLQAITKKPLLPSPEEIKNNPRARSAKLRVAEKL